MPAIQPSPIGTKFLLPRSIPAFTIRLHPMSTLSVLNLDQSDIEIQQAENLSLQNLVLQTEDQDLAPPLPETLEDTGLAGSVIEQLILKMLYSRGDMLGRDLSEALGLKFSLVEGFIELFKRNHSIQAKKSLGMGNSTSVFALTETGRSAAREAMEINQYAGAGAGSVVSIQPYRAPAAARRRLADA